MGIEVEKGVESDQLISLPDLQIVVDTIEKVYKLNLERGKIELYLKLSESDITKQAVNNKAYWVSDKPPSQAFIDSAYKPSGFSGELEEKRYRLIEIDAELSKYKSLLDFYRTIIDIWRTQSANERLSFG